MFPTVLDTKDTVRTLFFHKSMIDRKNLDRMNFLIRDVS